MTNAKLITPVLIAGCVVLILNFGIRASFGVFQIPIAAEFNWPRSDFSMAIAIQNLAWGIGQPIFGALAERFGDRKAIIVGALMYAVGLVLSSLATTPGQMQMLEVLVGFGIAGTGFGTILAIVGRASRPENRSLALGIASGIGSGGQVIGAPIAQALGAIAILLIGLATSSGQSWRAGWARPIPRNTCWPRSMSDARLPRPCSSVLT